MKIVYIAHPVALPDLQQNLQKIQTIARDLNLSRRDIVPFVPYMTDCLSLDDTDPKQRERGMTNNKALLASGVVDELWLYGDRISEGMYEEIRIALSTGITIKGATPQTQKALDEFMSQSL